MAEPRDLAEYQTDHDLIIELRTLVKVMNEKLDTLTGNFVMRAEFWPVKTLVFGCTGLILTGVIGAFLYLVIRH
jgi:hypothetical protein